MSKCFHKSSKSYNPGLKNGVSAESPDTWHLKYVKVLDSNAKNSAIAGKDLKPAPFLSNLKRNIAVIRPKFRYEDYSNSDGISYDVLTLHDRIDLLKNDEERVRCKTPFVKKWKKQAETQEKFKKFPGDFTITSNQPFLSRLTTGKIETLRKIVGKKNAKRKKTPEPVHVMNHERNYFKSNFKRLGRTRYAVEDFNSPELFGKEIKFFEKELAFVPDRKRWCYELQ